MNCGHLLSKGGLGMLQRARVSERGKKELQHTLEEGNIGRGRTVTLQIAPAVRAGVCVVILSSLGRGNPHLLSFHFLYSTALVIQYSRLTPAKHKR